MMFLWLVSLAAFPLLSLCSEECSLDHMQGCIKSLDSYILGGGFIPVSNREELHTLCSKFQDGISCVDRCLTGEKHDVFNKSTANVRQTLSVLCSPSDTQEAYLLHAPCYSNVSVSEEKCGRKYKHLAHLLKNAVAQMEIRYDDLCPALKDFHSCKSLFVPKDCGPDATSFMQKYMDRSYKSVINKHCSYYEDDIWTPYNSGGFNTLSVTAVCSVVLHVLTNLSWNRRNIL